MTLHDTQAKVLIAQSNIPLPPADIVMETPGKRSRLMSAIHKLGDLLRQNLSDSVSSEPVFSSVEGSFVLAQPGPSSEIVQSLQPDPTVTSLNTIGMSR